MLYSIVLYSDVPLTVHQKRLFEALRKEKAKISDIFRTSYIHVVILYVFCSETVQKAKIEENSGCVPNTVKMKKWRQADINICVYPILTHIARNLFSNLL